MGFIPNNTSAGPYGPASSRWQARLDGTDIDIVTGADGATGVVSGCAVSPQGSPNMTVAVGSGAVLIDGARVEVAAVESLAIPAADPAARRDLVTVDTSGTVAVVEGEPSENPVKPAIPSDRVVLAEVTVPAGDSTVGADQIIDKRVILVAPPNFETEPTLGGLQEFRRRYSQELRNWRSALANRNTNPVNVYFVGDSVTEGYGQTSHDKRWTELFRSSIQNAYWRGGKGFIPVTQGATPTWTAPWTIAGTPNQSDFGWGLGRRAILLDSTDDIITINAYCDRFWILYTSGTVTGTFKVTVDGTQVGTQNTLDNFQVSGRVWDSGQLGSLGTHAIRIEPNAASNSVVIDGIMLFAGDYDKGIHVWEGGHSGYTSSHFNNTSLATRLWADVMFQPHTRSTPVSGISGNGTTTITYPAAHGFDSNDIGEVIFSTSENGDFRGARIVSIPSSTTVEVNKVIPAGTYGLAITRARYTDATTTSASTTLTSATAAFAAWDTGKTISGTNIPSGTFIRRVVSATQIEMSKSATGSTSGSGTLQIKNRRKYPTNPSLFVVEFGYNELLNSQLKSSYKTQMTNVVQGALNNAQVDLPSMTGIVTDESPSIALLDLWGSGFRGNNNIVVSTTSGSATITSSSGSTPRFTSADVGKSITTAGNSPIPAGTTILSVQSPTKATLSANAVATNASATATIVDRQFVEEQWNDFRSAMRELCEENQWALLDIYSLTEGIEANDTLRLTTDGLHANDRGAQFVADELTKLLVEDSPKTIGEHIFRNAGELLVASASGTVRTVPGVKRVNSDAANSSNTVFTDITDLAWTMGPNETLSFQINLLYETASASTGIVFRMNGPASPTDVVISMASPSSASAYAPGGSTAFGTGITGSGGATAQPNLAIVSGTITTGAAGGTITPQFRTEVNGSAVTLQRGSWALIT